MFSLYMGVFLLCNKKKLFTIKYIVMKKLKILGLCLAMFGTTQAQVEYDLFNMYGAQGLGEMKGLNYFGMSTEFGYRIPETPFMINTFYSGGKFNRSEEQLPMYTEESGYSDDVRIRSNGGIRNLGLRVRYTPSYFDNRNFFPYIELGGGHARYRQNWTSRGDLTEDSTPDCPHYQHHERGWIHKSGTFYASGELGCMFRYPGQSKPAGKGAFFGFSVRYERGGLVNYADPSSQKQHFYYDSGLGEEFDRPFMNTPEASGRSILNTARHEQLMYKLTVLRVVF